MRKVNQSLSKKYLPVKLYLDDIEKITRLMSTHSESLRLQTEEYEFDSLEELIENIKQETINVLSLKTTNPYIHIEFDKIDAKIYFGSGETINLGLFYELDKIIVNCTRRFKWLYSFYVLFVGILLVPLDFLVLERYQSLAIFFTISIVVFSIWECWLLYVRFKRHSVIILSDKYAEKPFLQRNKDNLILVIISGVVGAALGVIGTLLVNYFSK